MSDLETDQAKVEARGWLSIAADYERRLTDALAEIERLRAALKIAREQVDANKHGRTAALMAIDGALNGGDAWAIREQGGQADGGR